MSGVFLSTDPAGDAARSAAPPSLSIRNNSTEKREMCARSHVVRSSEVLFQNVQAAIARFGIERVGLLTLTFSDHVLEHREANRRFNSLSSHVLGRYQAWVRVWERQASGRLHAHLVIVGPESVDWRTGLNFEEVAKRKYLTAGQDLRAEWAFWRKTAAAYGFGRTELLPIKHAEAAARYIGSYIGKHFSVREDRDKGARLVSYSQGWRTWFLGWQRTEGVSRQWRAKLAIFAEAYGAESLDDLSRIFGKRWAYDRREEIMRIPLPASYVFDSLEEARESSDAQSVRDWNGLSRVPAGLGRFRGAVLEGRAAATRERSSRLPTAVAGSIPDGMRNLTSAKPGRKSKAAMPAYQVKRSMCGRGQWHFILDE